MKRVPVALLIRKLTRVVDHCADEVSNETAALTPAQLNWQPNDRTWSVAQVLAHLNAYYRYYIPVFRGKISNTRFTEPTEHFTSSPLGIAVFRSVKLGKVKNVKRKLKSTKEYNPLINTSLSLDNVVEEYLEHVKDFTNVLHEGATINLRKTKCPLSLRPVVKLNMGDAFIFTAFHNERHLEQIKKVIRSARFPK
ncbi:MAG: hypothetical protein GQ574_22465 [Crocinitomix sp.]|nr:hypothetical protein [Crocinitomix sp.]